MSLIHELADVGSTLARTDTGAGLFTDVTDSPWPIFCGSVTSHRRAAVALGCPQDEIIDVMAHVLEPENGIAPVRLEGPAADGVGWKANSITGDEVESFAVEKDWNPFSVTAERDVQAGVVFAGYGIDAAGRNWNDYDGLDVKGKVVLVMRKSPGWRDQRHATFVRKLQVAAAA